MQHLDLNVLGISMRLESHEKMFSPLKADDGTIAMLAQADIKPDMKVLDLGCGLGLVGVYAAKFTQPKNVFLLDVDPLAVKIAARNMKLNGAGEATLVESDGFDRFFETDFDLILSNPPYHVDFSVPKRFLEKGFNRLAIGGRMILVVKRRTWYEMKMRALFGGVTVVETNGYFVLTGQRRSRNYAKKGKS